MITFWDRFWCGLLHQHERWREGDRRFRRCLNFGCSLLVIKDMPIAKLHRKSREAATKALRGGGRV